MISEEVIGRHIVHVGSNFPWMLSSPPPDWFCSFAPQSRLSKNRPVTPLSTLSFLTKRAWWYTISKCTLSNICRLWNYEIDEGQPSTSRFHNKVQYVCAHHLTFIKFTKLPSVLIINWITTKWEFLKLFYYSVNPLWSVHCFLSSPYSS